MTTNLYHLYVTSQHHITRRTVCGVTVWVRHTHSIHWRTLLPSSCCLACVSCRVRSSESHLRQFSPRAFEDSHNMPKSNISIAFVCLCENISRGGERRNCHSLHFPSNCLEHFCFIQLNRVFYSSIYLLLLQVLLSKLLLKLKRY